MLSPVTRLASLATLAAGLFALPCGAAVTTDPQATMTSMIGKNVSVYTTAAQTDLRLSREADLTFVAKAQPLETEPCVFVEPGRSFQTVVGIGGALTDSAAETYAKLPPATQQQFLEAYYDPKKGIGYSMARTNIASCDFSSGSYSYVAENDTALKSFSVAHDETYRIPFIHAATAAAGGKLPLFVSPWSPPAWMKNNANLLQGGSLRPEFRQAWANHYVEFIRAYEAHDIPIWGLSVQNEPMAKQKWESCLYTAEAERDFIRDYLGPTLAKAGLSSRKIIGWDHNRDLVFQRASTLLNDPEAAKYIWGIGFHWYETWTGSAMLFDNVKRVTESYPDKPVLLTEGCVEKFDLGRIHDWALGERYGLSLVNDFNSGAVAWIDWNVLLDQHGGPNHVGNMCFAPVHADTQTGKLLFTNSYYYLGHFSKFVRPGARRVAAVSSRDKLQATAFRNANGQLVVVVMNLSTDPLPYSVWIHGAAAKVTGLPHSISTFLID